MFCDFLLRRLIANIFLKVRKGKDKLDNKKDGLFRADNEKDS